MGRRWHLEMDSEDSSEEPFREHECLAQGRWDSCLRTCQEYKRHRKLNFSSKSERDFFLTIRTENTRLPAWSGPKLPVSVFISADAGSVGNRVGGLLALGGNWVRSLSAPPVSQIFLC